MLQIDFRGKVALVTGGGRGIGAAISSKLAQAGAVVWINYAHSGERAEQLCREIGAAGGVAVPIQADISQPEQVRGMVETVIAESGRIDFLINNAGITSVKSLLELTTEEWNRVMNVNLDGPFLTCKEVLPHMAASGEGVVVNISSTGALTGGGGGAHYAASKSALDSMTRALAREYAAKGIRVNGLAPTMIESDFLAERYPDEQQRSKLAASIPLGRLGTPEDVACMTAVLCSPFAGYLSGETIVMDGGRTFA
ncbi:SDR family NAD(P)-dependent oxidoreductase [Brevibacillus sp. B_LB10_24]|uniref:SDR family NAD(P)-dependent oxidoreductase n=1 Tax=Brevibacillus sp. B_LB10_24 TaxID=3380645 RepID=UPI0038BCF1C4